MTFDVWHADPPNFFGDRARAGMFPGGYVQAATVDAGSADDVFALTNHIVGNWTESWCNGPPACGPVSEFQCR